MSRFDPATYPGRRPDRPVLVYDGRIWDLRLDGTRRVPCSTEATAAGAPVLAADARSWCLAYGSNAAPDRLIDKGLDQRGVLVVPARVAGWDVAWEARRTSSTGAVPLTLVPAPGVVLDSWAVAVHPDDRHLLDVSEGRGTTYGLGRVGHVAVGCRFLLPEALAYGPGEHTRVLAEHGRTCTYPAYDQAAVAAMVDGGGAMTLATEPLPGALAGGWPPTPLGDLDVFVYGTLQPGEQRWPQVEPYVEVVGRGWARGALTATYYGWPAASFEGGGRVHGVVLRAVDAEAARALYELVDRIEDTPSLFRRVAVLVDVEGERRWAAAYAWNAAQGPPPGDAVPGGRWSGVGG